MTVLLVPPIDEEPWPTLGPQVCAFYEAFLIHGPGDVRGEPAVVDAETRGFIYRAYEVYPQWQDRPLKGRARGRSREPHPQAGRRRWKRVGLSKRKGTSKSEKLAWVSAGELHPDGPVRCDGFDELGEPVGRGIVDPYIPMVAFTQEQSEELGYGALKVILEEGPLVGDFDIGWERILRKAGDGKAVPLSTAPSSRDGARTSFQAFDETHHLTSPRQTHAHQVMLGNVPKRKDADAWTLEATTAFEPGEGSVAEGTMDAAQQIAEGKVRNPRLFFFHRQAGDQHDLDTEDGRRAALIEASSEHELEYTDVESVLALADDPQTDFNWWERTWLNRPVRSSRQAFDIVAFDENEDPRDFDRADPVVGGFDGSRFRDATGLIGKHVASGYEWLVAVWEHPGIAEPHRLDDDWEVPGHEVDDAVDRFFADFNVWALAADPQWWESDVDRWASRHGERRVIRWWTHVTHRTAWAVHAYANALKAGEIPHDGDPVRRRHTANARRRYVNVFDDQGQKLFLIEKERRDSPKVIDLAMAGTIANDVRNVALRKGALDDDGDEGPAPGYTF